MMNRNGLIPHGMAAVLCITAACGTAPAQIRVMQGGIQVEHSEYNDLLTQVNRLAETVFRQPDTRAASAPEFLAALDRLTPMIRAESTQHPAPIFNDELRMHAIFRLALDEPKSVSANQAAIARVGPGASTAAINRAAAAWLDAGQNPAAQFRALDALRSAIAQSGQGVSYELWWDLLQYNPPASAAVGTPLLAYLQPYRANPQGLRMLNIWGSFVKRMELEGRPVIFNGTLLSGARFSTAAWKGKVILINGWVASRQDVENLPQIQQLFDQYHAGGLEVLAIAYGQGAGQARAVLAQHPEFTFPEIFDASHPDIAEICGGMTSFGLRGETLGPERLIDRKGILHYLVNKGPSQDFDGQLQAEIVKLLSDPS